MDAGELLYRMAAQHNSYAERHAQKILVEVDGAMPVIAADPQRLEQVMGNLMNNALRITPEGGSITLRGKTDGTGVRLEVEDSGPGIPPEELENIFDRFYQLDDTRMRSENGSGLGLAIARKLVEAHGGTLTAENRAEGGARFILRLPGG